MNLIFAGAVVLWTAWLIVKRFKAQVVLLASGMFLLSGSILLGFGSFLPAEDSTGLWSLDLFELLRSLFSSRLAGMGLNIMAVGGFARYMDKIGASHALVNLATAPLMKLQSPYLVMSICWLAGMFLGLAINSASGLAMLLMVTMFPILVALGVSRLSAAAAIATTLCLDWSPADAVTIFAAELCGIDPVVYWHTYEIPIVLTVAPIVAATHFFTQKIMDRRAGHEVHHIRQKDIPIYAETEEEQKILKEHPPLIFAVLPVLPLALILTFSPLFITSIHMNIIMAMFIGTAAGMLAQWIHTKNIRQTCDELQDFFDGMGVQLAQVVTLIVAGEFFARGLTATGAIDTLIRSAEQTGFNAAEITLVIALVIAASSILMGSGNAPFFAFANLIPDIAAKAGIHTAFMVLPAHFIASSARGISPITGVIIIVSGMAGVAPFSLIKRTFIPMVVSCILILSCNLIYFG